jgi:RNA polymerase sigma factor (sigma-70 family)
MRAYDQDDLVHRIEDWVWDYSEGELEQLEREVAAWLARARTDLRHPLAAQADETLAQAVKKGFFSAPAFTELFCHRFEGRLLTWFHRWGVEENTAFDLAQEVFLKFHVNRLEGYNPDMPFVCYLRRMAYNLFVTRCCRGRRPVPTDDLGWVQAANGAEDEAERREAEGWLEEKLAELPADLRAVMELHLEGLSPQEAAHTLGTTVKVFYGRLHRARVRLAAALDVPLPPSNRGRKPKKDRSRPEDRTPPL